MTSTTEWNEATKTGNPTKSQLVNNLIKAVKKKGTQGQGKKIAREIDHSVMMSSSKLSI